MGKAYYDSGNTLYKKSRPVCIVNKKIIKKSYSSKKKNKINNEIKINTINGTKDYNLILLDEVFILEDEICFKDVYAAVCNIKDDFDMLLHVDMR